jgi:hypothetical protein
MLSARAGLTAAGGGSLGVGALGALGHPDQPPEGALSLSLRHDLPSRSLAVVREMLPQGVHVEAAAGRT